MIGFGHLARRLVELLRPFERRRSWRSTRSSRVSWPRPTASSSARSTRVLDCRRRLRAGAAHARDRGDARAAQLELAPPGSVLVNVSRGKVIDTPALVARLGQGDVDRLPRRLRPRAGAARLAAAATSPNVFLTPHIAGYTEESRRRFFSLMVDECLRHFAGLEPWSRADAANVSALPRSRSAPEARVRLAQRPAAGAASRRAQARGPPARGTGSGCAPPPATGGRCSTASRRGSPSPSRAGRGPYASTMHAQRCDTLSGHG